ncbi:hypothetical protein ACOMHN_054868 [Nucella lapillus]
MCPVAFYDYFPRLGPQTPVKAGDPRHPDPSKGGGPQTLVKAGDPRHQTLVKAGDPRPQTLVKAGDPRP